MSGFHTPVLLQSVCTLLNVQPGRKYVDATLGGGGHTAAIVELGGRVLGLDQDPDAIAACRSAEAFQPALASAQADPQLVLVRANFIHLSKVVQQHSWQPLWGILLDLGVSLHQLVTPQRGFSFQSVGPLDMRMDPDLPNSAATLVNVLTVKQLEQLFREYGEEPAATAVARRIVSARPLATTDELARILTDAHQRRRVFQSLRIAVNDELAALSAVLPQAFDLLHPGGRLVIISFHSLEDRIVKNQFSAWIRSGRAVSLTDPPVTPGPEEISANPHAQSAKLRSIEKI